MSGWKLVDFKKKHFAVGGLSDKHFSVGGFSEKPLRSSWIFQKCDLSQVVDFVSRGDRFYTNPS